MFSYKTKIGGSSRCDFPPTTPSSRRADVAIASAETAISTANGIGSLPLYAHPCSLVQQVECPPLPKSHNAQVRAALDSCSVAPSGSVSDTLEDYLVTDDVGKSNQKKWSTKKRWVVGVSVGLSVTLILMTGLYLGKQLGNKDYSAFTNRLKGCFNMAVWQIVAVTIVLALLLSSLLWLKWSNRTLEKQVKALRDQIEKQTKTPHFKGDIRQEGLRIAAGERTKDVLRA